MGEEKDHKSEIIMHYNATKSGADVLNKACEGIHLYEIDKTLAFETFPQLD
jgi:hypothetical protein